jgi:TonB family protein
MSIFRTKFFIPAFIILFSFSLLHAQHHSLTVGGDKKQSSVADTTKFRTTPGVIEPDTNPTRKKMDSALVYTIVQQMPKYPGDLYKFIGDSLKYPEKERDHNITGTVYITFVVEKDGAVTDVRVLKGVPNGPGLDAEAVRVISMLKK